MNIILTIYYIYKKTKREKELEDKNKKILRLGKTSANFSYLIIFMWANGLS